MGESAGAVRVGVRVIVAWGSLAVAAACLTVLFLGMRSVMEIGGFCASGGPYVIEDRAPRCGPPGHARPSVDNDDVDPDDFTTRLERLAAMYRRGDLNAAEFEAAKSKLLTESGGS